MKTPVYSSAAWRAQVPTLLTIAAEGTLEQRRQAITLLGRELAGRLWSSVWQPAADHFVFRDLALTPESDPAAILRASYTGGGGADVADRYASWASEGGAGFPTTYGRRMASEQLEDGTVRNYPIVAGPPGQAEITADCTTRAAALIEWGP